MASASLMVSVSEALSAADSDGDSEPEPEEPLSSAPSLDAASRLFEEVVDDESLAGEELDGSA